MRAVNGSLNWDLGIKKPGQDRSCPGRGYGDWNQAMVSRRSAMLSILLTAAAAVMDMTLPETEI